MKEGPDIARIAALIGDPARANILTALMTGKALTATELAAEAGVSAQTASAHLAKLHDGGLIRFTRHGRHKFISLARDDVARVLESLMGLAAGAGHLRSRTGPRDPALRQARVCYDHLAGDRGVQMFDSLARRGLIRQHQQAVLLTDDGRGFLARFGVDLDALPASRAPMCRACLDWSERRMHLAGRVGRALLVHLEEIGWARRQPDTRAIGFSRVGAREFDRTFPGA